MTNIRVQCSWYSMGAAEWGCCGFDEDDAIRLFCTNWSSWTARVPRLRLKTDQLVLEACRLCSWKVSRDEKHTSSVCGLFDLSDFQFECQCWPSKWIYWFGEGPCLQWANGRPTTSSQIHLGGVWSLLWPTLLPWQPWKEGLGSNIPSGSRR